MAQGPRISIAALWRWGPVLALMALIFVSSAQPKIEQPDAGAVYFSGLIPIFADGWDFAIKKSAHVAAYGLLAALLWRALRQERRTIGQAALLALAITAAYAISDELHQSFVPGRNASLLDLGFDMAGAILALALLVRRAARRGPLSAGSTSYAAGARPGPRAARTPPAGPSA